MNAQFCQCCGMPMNSEELYGTEADGSKSNDYCKYCYDKGNVTFDGSMEDMIEFCIPHMVEGNPDMTAERARIMMEQFFPTLKHWKKS